MRAPVRLLSCWESRIPHSTSAAGVGGTLHHSSTGRVCSCSPPFRSRCLPRTPLSLRCGRGAICAQIQRSRRLISSFISHTYFTDKKGIRDYGAHRNRFIKALKGLRLITIKRSLICWCVHVKRVTEAHRDEILPSASSSQRVTGKNRMIFRFVKQLKPEETFVFRPKVVSESTWGNSESKHKHSLLIYPQTFHCL